MFFVNSANAYVGTTIKVHVFDRRTAGQKSVGLHTEGSETGQIDQIFFVVFLGPRAIAEMVPRS